MKSTHEYTLAAAVMVFALAGCAKQETGSVTTKSQEESAARAEAAKSEMQKLPATFAPRYNQKIDYGVKDAAAGAVNPAPKNEKEAP